MRELLLTRLPAFLDILALATVIGILTCRLWVLPHENAAQGGRVGATAWARLRRLLLSAVALLTLTGFLLLAARAQQMSRQPLEMLPAVLPKVLGKTHYGTVWLARSGALAGLWLGWWGLVRSSRRFFPAFMLAMAAIIAWSVSASGHAADWGDFTWTEGLHWLHLLCACLWSGTLLAMACLSSLLVPATAGRKDFIAHSMPRLARLSLWAVIGVLASGAFQAAVQLGDLHALWHTDYGKMLDIKLSLVLAMLVLWAVNRWAVVPVLRPWLATFATPRDAEQDGEAPRTPAEKGGRSFARFGQGGIGAMTLWHRRLMTAGAVLLTAVLLCAVLLAFRMPPRGHVTMHHMQNEEKAVPGG